MRRIAPSPVVHLELHTGELQRARALYAELLGWRSEQLHTEHGSYLALLLGGAALDGGIVECPSPRALWLPYVEVEHVHDTTELACTLGASVLLAPREGPSGWRSVIASAAGGELALWQPKR